MARTGTAPPASEQKKLPGIFISYRRHDNPDATGRIYDRLVSEFGKARVFKDVDSIPLGQDFRGHLDEVVAGCAAMLAIIGPRWTDARNSGGQRRLEDPDDFVRIELEAALARGIPVVPVLVGHAAMPGSTDLPPSLLSMVYRQSIEARPDPDFHNDCTRLVEALKRILDPDAPVVTYSSPARPLKWMAAAGVALLAAAVLAIPAVEHLRETPPPESRLDIVTPDTAYPFHFALSPDGRWIAFVARGDGASRLWLRPLAGSATDAQPLPGTEGATAPFWKPDSHSIGFFAKGQLQRLDIVEGRPQASRPLAPAQRDDTALSTISGTWNGDDVILYSGGPGAPLKRVDANTGEATDALGSPDSANWYAFPRFLPDGRHFLFMSQGGVSQSGIYLGTLGGGAPVWLNADTSGPAEYLSSGWMFWARRGAIAAQRLDLRKARLTGRLLTLADRGGNVSVSESGQLAYRTAVALQAQLRWVDQKGNSQGTVGEPGFVSSPCVARDRVVYSLHPTQVGGDVYVLDGASPRPLTSGLNSRTPICSADGTRIAFVSNRADGPGLYQKTVNGAGVAELLVAGSNSGTEVDFPTSYSVDGRFLLYFHADGYGTEARGLSMADKKSFPLFAKSRDIVWPEFSPDQKWVAYQSPVASGRNEIYVRPFAAAAGGATANAADIEPYPVSRKGGIHPLWRGDHIYYLDPEGQMMAAKVTMAGSIFKSADPVVLFQTHIRGGGADNTQGRQYDVAPDGRFLINAERIVDTAPAITLIQNWNPEGQKQ